MKNKNCKSLHCLFLVCCLFVHVFCGTVYKTVYREGTGSPPKPGQTVTVHYRGYLKNGPQFDSSYDRNETFKFKLGNNEVIKGWEAGISSMNVGEMSKLEIAPEDAYGEQGNGPIPKNAELVFYIELLKVEGIPAPKATHMGIGSNVQPTPESLPTSPVFDPPGQGLPPQTFPSQAVGQGQGQGQTFGSSGGQGQIFTPPDPPAPGNQVQQFRGSLIRQDQVVIPQQQQPASPGQGQLSSNSLQPQSFPGFPPQQGQNIQNNQIQGQPFDINSQQTNMLQGQTFGQTFPGQPQPPNSSFDPAIPPSPPQGTLPGQTFTPQGQPQAPPTQTFGTRFPASSQNFVSPPQFPQTAAAAPSFTAPGAPLPPSPGRQSRFSPALSSTRQVSLPQAPPPGPALAPSSGVLPPSSRGSILPPPGQDTQFGRITTSVGRDGFAPRSPQGQMSFGSRPAGDRIPGRQDFRDARIPDPRFDPAMNDLRGPPMMEGVDPRLARRDPAFPDTFPPRDFRTGSGRSMTNFMRSRGGGFPPDFPPRDMPPFRGPRRFPDPRSFRGFPVRFGRDIDPMYVMMERSRRARMRRRF